MSIMYTEMRLVDMFSVLRKTGLNRFDFELRGHHYELRRSNNTWICRLA